jgi:3-phenylpropionate/trans-cinnamate dioxygenase ferredoxin reductase subunit
VGASLAGLRAAEALRDEGFTGAITLVGDEPDRPYDRPPLTKQCLAGRLPLDHTALAPLRAIDAEWRLGVRASALDCEERTLRLDNGDTLGFDGVLIATGLRARPFPDAAAMALEGVTVLRTRAQAQRLLTWLDARPQRVVVVGGGLIGCEVAASCCERQIPVSLVVQQRVPLMSSLSRALGVVVDALFRQKGVDVRCQSTVERIEGDASGKVRQVHLRGGVTLDADVVVVALGSECNTEWLQGAGLQADKDGVVCDSFARARTAEGTTLDHVWVAGDVSRFPHPLFGPDLLRVEHWGNAVTQARTAAHNMLAAPEHMRPHDALPVYWTHLFGINVKVVGVPRLADEVALVQGKVEERRFVAVYGRSRKTVGAVSFNSARWLQFYAGLVRSQAPLPLDLGGVDSPRPIQPVAARFARTAAV